MKTKSAGKGLPSIVSESKWQKAREQLLVREKAMTRAGDALAARRRRMPMVEITKAYEFQSEAGKLSLLNLFEGRRQLLLYHFMYAPDTQGWPTAGCPGCPMVVDQLGHLAHFHARDTTFCAVSLAPLTRLKAYKKRMGWRFPWVSSAGSDFNGDFGVTTDDGEIFGLSVFLRDGDRVFRTYFVGRRGIESLGSLWSYLDVTPFGRQEKWEDTPPGRPQGPVFSWWRRHDSYGKSAGL
jgi:predicted dithiol-disulfide oxidoreductase (DUF899 family)